MNEKGSECMTMITQEEVRKKYAERTIREKQSYISKVTGIPAPVLSEFKAGRKLLFESSLIALNNYLDGN